MSETDASLKQIVEAALFAADEPLSTARIQGLFDEGEAPAKPEVDEALAALEADYAGRGVRLVATGGGYQFQTAAATNPWIHRLFQARAPRFSRAVLETLAIIAYRQPTTRSEIEDIRGVSLSSGVMKTLTDRGWVQVVGRKDVPGRPSLYGTTRDFLSYFGLNSLDELPPLKEIQEGDAEALAAGLAGTEAPEPDETGGDGDE
jgi:segregation and condensation protein B